MASIAIGLLFSYQSKQDVINLNNLSPSSLPQNSFTALKLYNIHNYDAVFFYPAAL